MDGRIVTSILLFIACIAAELSLKVNTTNVIKKVGIGFIAVGALAQFGGGHSSFVEIGILIYLISNILSAYVLGHTKRKSDNETRT